VLFPLLAVVLVPRPIPAGRPMLPRIARAAPWSHDVSRGPCGA